MVTSHPRNYCILRTVLVSRTTVGKKRIKSFCFGTTDDSNETVRPSAKATGKHEPREHHSYSSFRVTLSENWPQDLLKGKGGQK